MPAMALPAASANERRMMVDCQLRTYDITDRAVLAAFGAVPREAFVAPGAAGFAYADRDVPALGRPDRVVIAPMVLARMIQALRIAPGARALDVAGGAGYGAAILRELGAAVTAIESAWPAEAVAPPAGERGGNVCIEGDIAEGCPANAPYDAILLHGAIEAEPGALIAQLRDGGRLVCGESTGEWGRIVSYERLGSSFRKRNVVDAQLPALAEFAAKPVFVF